MAPPSQLRYMPGRCMSKSDCMCVYEIVNIMYKQERHIMKNNKSITRITLKILYRNKCNIKSIFFQETYILNLCQ